MNKQQLDLIYSEVIQKPQSYHYVCYGGGTVKMVDSHTNSNKYTCRYQGDKNWITPACEKCMGLFSDAESLTDYQETMNYGSKKLYDAIIRTLEE